jgi:hypothetical protein
MADSIQRDFLNSKFAQILGFEDGVDDVVDHLLTIDSKEVWRKALSWSPSFFILKDSRVVDCMKFAFLGPVGLLIATLGIPFYGR